MAKIRIDQLLVERGLVESRSLAQRMIIAGKVRADGQLVFKPAQQVSRDSVLNIDPGNAYVSRGGDKLAAALDQFEVVVDGMICADVGASTGGFTDCLLQHGAKRVFAIDVGHGQLHWNLRNHPRVVVMERTNARYLASLAEQVDLITIDVSFISLKLILQAAVRWMEGEGRIIALIKPQFEAGKEAVGKGGVVRDSMVHEQVIRDVLQAADDLELNPFGLIRSPLKGPKGNVEFLVGLDHRVHNIEIHAMIQGVLVD